MNRALFASIVVAVFSLAAAALSAPPQAAPAAPQIPLRATVESIHDGDTLRVTIHLPFGIDLPGRDVRAFGYDAWEIDRRRRTVNVTDAELAKGAEAKKIFAALLVRGGCWLDDSGERDPYGRISARIWTKGENGEWIDVADAMRDSGMTRGESDGQRREGTDSSAIRPRDSRGGEPRRKFPQSLPHSRSRRRLSSALPYGGLEGS